jgi:hypothetical protein
MGGAIGVAVFGSIMASHFTSEITTKLSGTLPQGLLSDVRDNVSTAVGIARGGGAQTFSGQVLDAAGQSFVSGLHVIGLVAAGITLVAAIGVAIFLPARARVEDAIVLDGAREGEEPLPVGAGVVA